MRFNLNVYEKDSVLYDASLIGRSCLLSISFSGVDVNSRSLRENESDIKPRNSDQRRTTCFASLLMKLRRMLRDMMLKRGYKDSKYTYEIRLLWIVENMSIIGYFHFRSIMILKPLKICLSIGLTEPASNQWNSLINFCQSSEFCQMSIKDKCTRGNLGYCI